MSKYSLRYTCKIQRPSKSVLQMLMWENVNENCLSKPFKVDIKGNYDQCVSTTKLSIRAQTDETA